MRFGFGFVTIGFGCLITASSFAWGCGSDVATGTSGHSESVSGSGGASSTSASSSQGGGGQGSGASGGGGAATCSAMLGTTCASDEFCQYGAEPGICGGADRSGVCLPRPRGCTNDCPGICGCDGLFYCNACSAHAAGFDVSTSASCLGTYSLHPLATGVSRFAIFKIDDSRGVCLRIIVENFGSSGTLPIELPPDWSIGQAEITNDVSDCQLDNGFVGPPQGDAVVASGGSGFIDFDSGGPPPSLVTIHATLAFPDGSPPWVPASEPLDADDLSAN